MKCASWKIHKFIHIIIFFFLSLCFSSFAQKGEIQFNPDEFLKIERLSERVLLVGMGAVYYDAITAIATEKGIVVIDAGLVPTDTKKYREIIENEFARNDFIYLINTHGHFDHTNGNQVFSDAKIVAHDHCVSEMIQFWNDSTTIDNSFYKAIGRIQNQLNTLAPDSEMWKFYKVMMYKYKTIQSDLENDFQFTLPMITFNDKLSLELGDMRMHLIYFGEAHTKSDIMIYVPEEKMLFIGDLFEKGGEPDFEMGNNEHNLRWLEVMDWLFQSEMKIDRVVYGHGLIFLKEDLIAFKNKIRKMD